MRRMIEKMMRSHGRQMRVFHRGEESTVFGFLQPVTGKGENMGRIKLTALGICNGGRFIYIGPAEPALEIGDELEVDGKRYVIHRAERYNYGWEDIYTWGMCQEKDGEGEWGTNS